MLNGNLWTIPERGNANKSQSYIRRGSDQGCIRTRRSGDTSSLRRTQDKTSRMDLQACKHEWQTSQQSRTDIPTCPDCGADSPNEDERRTMDIVDELSLLATRTSANVSLVSLDSEEVRPSPIALAGLQPS